MPSGLPPLLPSTITATAFATALSRYGATIARKSAGYASAARNLDELDNWRCEKLPKLVRERKSKEASLNGDSKSKKSKKDEGNDGESGSGSESGDGCYIKADELVDLTYCKLKRGKFRPLAGLVASNSEPKVIKASRTAFSLLTDPSPTRESVLAALKAVSTPLSGVGPATASYILAVYHPNNIPVFSDEGYRWVMFEQSEGKGKNKGKGWEREMKYDLKEYAAYFDGAQKIAERLSVTAREVEKVAYVLGREAEEDESAGGAGAKRKAAAEKKKAGAAEKRQKRAAAAVEGGANVEEGENGEGDGEKQATGRGGRVLRNRTTKSYREG